VTRENREQHRKEQPISRELGSQMAKFKNIRTIFNIDNIIQIKTGNNKQKHLVELFNYFQQLST